MTQPTPDLSGYTKVAILSPHGRVLSHVTNQLSIDRLKLHPFADPRNGRPMYVHPYLFETIGDEYARGRNQLVANVLTAEREMKIEFDFVLWVDDDMIIPEDALERLMRHDTPIASGLYFMRMAPHLPVAYVDANDPDNLERYWNLSTYPENQITEVDGVGMGCCLVKMEVFRKLLPQPWFQWRIAPDVQPHGFDHRAIGEDLYFCRLARQHGLKVLLDTSVLCQHIGEKNYGAEDFKEIQMLGFRFPPPGRLSICIVCSPSPKPFDGTTIYKEGLGGSESAAVYLARSLARRHHVVYVICNTPGDAPTDVDGVCYRPYHTLGRALIARWDAVIVSRLSDIMTQTMSAEIQTLFFWAHDIMQPDQIAQAQNIHYPNELPPDYFICLTPFHQSILSGLLATVSPAGTRVPFTIVPNGLDLSLFEEEEERVPGRMMWTSNPNRGLAVGVKIFRKLRKRWPHLELHIYGRSAMYGWTAESDPQHESAYLPHDEPGVFLHDPLPKHLLAKELLKSWAWFYSSTYMETFSIAAIEAQAAGCPVISVPLAALPDTVQGGYLDWDIEASVEKLMDDDEWERQSLRGREWTKTLDWDRIAGMWEQLILDRQAQKKRQVWRT